MKVKAKGSAKSYGHRSHLGKKAAYKWIAQSGWYERDWNKYYGVKNNE